MCRLRQFGIRHTQGPPNFPIHLLFVVVHDPWIRRSHHGEDPAHSRSQFQVVVSRRHLRFRAVSCRNWSFSTVHELCFRQPPRGQDLSKSCRCSNTASREFRPRLAWQTSSRLHHAPYARKVLARAGQAKPQQGQPRPGHGFMFCMAHTMCLAEVPPQLPKCHHQCMAVRRRDRLPCQLQ